MSKVRVTLPGASTRMSYFCATTSSVILRTTQTLEAGSTPMAPPGTMWVRRSERRRETATDCGVRTPAATWGRRGR